MITLQKVNKENWKEACSVDIKPEQQKFLSSVTYCLARAYANPYKEPIIPYVIVKYGVIVGFFWITFSDCGMNCILCGFRIDKRYQGLGYSKLALKEIVRLLKAEYTECVSIQLFVEKDNYAAMNLYDTFGFKVIDRNVGDLIHMLYLLKQDSIPKIVTLDYLDD